MRLLILNGSCLDLPLKSLAQGLEILCNMFLCLMNQILPLFAPLRNRLSIVHHDKLYWPDGPRCSLMTNNIICKSFSLSFI